MLENGGRKQTRVSVAPHRTFLHDDGSSVEASHAFFSVPTALSGTRGEELVHLLLDCVGGSVREVNNGCFCPV